MLLPTFVELPGVTFVTFGPALSTGTSGVSDSTLTTCDLSFILNWYPPVPLLEYCDKTAVTSTLSPTFNSPKSVALYKFINLLFSSTNFVLPLKLIDSILRLLIFTTWDSTFSPPLLSTISAIVTTFPSGKALFPLFFKSLYPLIWTNPLKSEVLPDTITSSPTCNSSVPLKAIPDVPSSMA